MTIVTEKAADEHFAERLKRRRILLGYSQEELATLSGKRNRQRMISRWERGLGNPQPGEPLRAVAEILRVTPGWLLRGWEEEA